MYTRDNIIGLSFVIPHLEDVEYYTALSIVGARYPKGTEIVKMFYKSKPGFDNSGNAQIELDSLLNYLNTGKYPIYKGQTISHINNHYEIF
jgi:hypothetical protein